MILLDTHAAIWLATDNSRLGYQSRRLAETAIEGEKLAMSAISFWEIALLSAKKRLDMSSTPAELRTLLLDTGMVEIPLGGDIAILSADLDLHADPADRFIAATAIIYRATLVTADERLLRWEHTVMRQNASQ